MGHLVEPLQCLLQQCLYMLWAAIKSKNLITILNPPQRCVHDLNLLIMLINVEDCVEQMIKTK